MCLNLANILAELTGGIVVKAALHENEGTWKKDGHQIGLSNNKIT
jgi:hypothetical protein